MSWRRGWRPDGWDEMVEFDSKICTTPFHSFEAGADAMLGVRDKDWRSKILILNATVDNTIEGNKIFRSMILSLIPEETKEDEMKDIDKIVAEMPKAEFPSHWVHDPTRQYEWDRAIKAQCQLVVEQGYRPVPSEEEFELKFCELVTRPSVNDLAHRTAQAVLDLHRWLLKGE